MRKIIVFVLVCITAINVYGMDIKSKDNLTVNQLEEVVVELFIKRAEILNNYLIGEYTIEEVNHELRDIVTGALLKDDLEIINYINISPTSFEIVEHIKVNDIKLLRKDETSSEFKLGVEWNMKNKDYNLVEDVTYQVDVKKRKSNWLLSNINVT
ncbi:hypothetical protein RH915_00415 [Serpentinicella sp. ANB-PHB4]|uniref:hypothetical protein n=1 Tax=Serpentinicella sp. ANB-PHB4 TaxID=3074076 RepID=UPI002866CAA1|nr:hypothetical protein [Serpentinicella sp. ANB-PHB4]MDR5657943.1 hypothetical protein [Serpentinicella sp. ANB-PHB4]